MVLWEEVEEGDRIGDRKRIMFGKEEEKGENGKEEKRKIYSFWIFVSFCIGFRRFMNFLKLYIIFMCIFFIEG